MIIWGKLGLTTSFRQRVIPHALQLALLLLVQHSVTACAKRSLTEALVDFPSRDALADYQGDSLESLVTAPVKSTREWTLEYPVEDQLGPSEIEEPNAWQRLVLAEPNGAQLTKGMTCAAAEIARFYAEHDAQPDPGVRSFVLGRCGVSTHAVGIQSISAAVPASVPESRLLQDWKDSVRTAWLELEGSPRLVAGIAVHRAEGRAVLAIVSASPEVRLQPVSALPAEDGKVTLSGHLTMQVEHATAVINQEQYGFKECARVGGDLPEFTFECTVHENDAVAWVDIVVLRPGRKLADSPASFLIHRGTDESMHYQRHPAGAERWGHDSETSVDTLNRIRARAALPELKFAGKQSKVNSAVLPALIVRSHQNDVEAVEQISLGLIAGWEVREPIGSGDLFVSSLSGSDEPSAWWEHALSSPLARSVLFSPDADQVAIGIASTPRLIGGVVTTYYEFDRAEVAQTRLAIFEQIAGAREKAGLPAPELTTVDEQEVPLQQLNQGKTPGEALRVASEAMVGRGHEEIGALVVALTGRDAFEVPKELLRPGSLKLAISATYYEPKDAAWGQYVLFLFPLK